MLKKISNNNKHRLEPGTKIHIDDYLECPIMTLEEVADDGHLKLYGLSKLSKSFKKIVIHISPEHIAKETYVLYAEIPNSLDFIMEDE